VRAGLLSKIALQRLAPPFSMGGGKTTRLFEDRESVVDRDAFTRAVSRSGWISSLGGDLPGKAAAEPRHLLACQARYLSRFEIGASSISVRGAYSSISYSLHKGGRINVFCFLGNTTEKLSQFGLTVTYNWNLEYADAKSVPLDKIRDILGQFLDQLNEACISCGIGSVAWI
jgi:hypothetical protein